MDRTKAKRYYKFKISEVSPKQKGKIEKDLMFIELALRIAKQHSLRTVIAGGYAVDGNLGQITRPHNDIDIQLYGNNPDGKKVILNLLQNIALSDSKFSGMEVKVDHGRKTFYYGLLAEIPGLGADFYYIQVDGDPFTEEKTVIKDNYEKTEPHQYNTIQVNLEGVAFEAQNPKTELEDKIKKRDSGEKVRTEIEQDIYNLKLLLKN